MKIAILTANLRNFDTNMNEPVKQVFSDSKINGEVIEYITFHRFTDENFPPIADLSGRFQYRIPKMFGWEMVPKFDIYLWMDGGMNILRKDSVEWFLKQLGDSDMAFFKHPWRNTIREEVDHIEERLQRGDKYITPRYKNGLHKEYFNTLTDSEKDDYLFASNVFIYRNNIQVQAALSYWWFLQSRYFTCDQVHLTHALYRYQIKSVAIPENVFKNPYVSLVSKHH